LGRDEIRQYDLLAVVACGSNQAFAEVGYVKVISFDIGVENFANACCAIAGWIGSVSCGQSGYIARCDGCD
jgi:hypothetical protein